MSRIRSENWATFGVQLLFAIALLFNLQPCFANSYAAPAEVKCIEISNAKIVVPEVVVGSRLWGVRKGVFAIEFEYQNKKFSVPVIRYELPENGVAVGFGDFGAADERLFDLAQRTSHGGNVKVQMTSWMKDSGPFLISDVRLASDPKSSIYLGESQPIDEYVIGRLPKTVPSDNWYMEPESKFFTLAAVVITAMVAGLVVILRWVLSRD